MAVWQKHLPTESSISRAGEANETKPVAIASRFQGLKE